MQAVVGAPIFWSLLASLLLLMMDLVPFVSSQGVERICSCTPLVYTWKLDFSRTCTRNNININIGETTGIRSAACDVIDPNVIGPSAVTDFEPVVVVSYQIIELGLDLIPIKVDGRSNLELFSESVILFSSITASQENVTSGGLQASVVGFNADNQRIQLNWIVRYTNLCEVLPFSADDSLGWMVVETTDPGTLPRPGTCFLASKEPSITPSFSPSVSPTIKASEQPSSSSISPSGRPTRLRTTPGPSAFPSRIETGKPSRIPTMMPTTLEVSMSYSYSYSFSFSYNLQEASYSQYHQTEFGRTTVLEEEEEWC